MKRTLIFLILSLLLISASIAYADRIDNLIKILKTGTGEQKRSAIHALAKIKDKRAVEPLIQILRQDKGSLRRTAAYALGRIGDKRAVGPLLKVLREVLESDSSSGMKDIDSEPIIGALGTIGDKRAVGPLIKILRNDKENMSIRTRTVWALMDIGGQRAEEALREIREKDKAPAIQETTKYALAKLDKKKIQALQKVVEPKIDNIIKSLETGTPEQKIEALRKLKYVEDHPVKRKAVKPVIKLLNHSDIQVRQDATQSLDAFMESKYGKVREALLRAIKEDKARPHLNILIKGIQDKDKWVRTTAAKSLAAKIEIKEVLDFFINYLFKSDADKDVRIKLLSSLMRGYRPWVTEFKDKKLLVKPLEKVFIADSDKKVRSQAARVLGAIGDKDSVPALVKVLTTDSDKEIRSQAAGALGAIGNKDSISALIKALEDDETFVRRAAASALKWSKDKEVVIPLVATLENELKKYKLAPSGDTAQAICSIICTLERLDDNRATDILIQALEYDRFRTSAIRALDKLEDPKSAKALIPLLKKDIDPRVRIDSMRVLKKIEGEKATPYILDVFEKDTNPKVRKEAARILESIGDEKAIGPLETALKDPNKEVAKAARRALLRITGKDYSWKVASPEQYEKNTQKIIELTEKIKSDKIGERQDAIHALEKIKDKRTIEPLLLALKDEEYTIRGNTASALARIVEKLDNPEITRRVIPEVKKLLNDEEAYVRTKALYTLCAIDTKEILPLVLGKINSKDEKVQSEGIGALSEMEAEIAIPKLVEILQDEKRPKNIRYAALSGINRVIYRLRYVGYRRIRKPLYKLTTKPLLKIIQDKGSENKLKIVAAETINLIKDPDTVEPLINLLKVEDNSYIKFTLIKTLGELKDRRALPVLDEMTKDSSRRVRAMADQAIKSILPSREYEARVKGAEEAKKKVKRLMREGKKAYAQKNISEAIKNFEEAVSILERIREERPEKFSQNDLNRALTYLAFIHYLDLRESEKAISYLKKLLTYYEKKTASTQDFIIIYNNFWIAKIYETELRDYSKALLYYEKCTNYALEMMKKEEARCFFLQPVALSRYYYDDIKVNVLKERRYKFRPLKIDYLSFRALQFGYPTMLDYILLGEPFIELLMASKDLSISEERGREGTVKLYWELGGKYSGTYVGLLLKFYALKYSYIYLPSFLKYAEDYGYDEEALGKKELLEKEKRLFEPFALDFIKKYPDDLLTLYVRLNLKDFYHESGEGVKEKKIAQAINEFTSQRNIQVKLEPDKRYATPEKTWKAFRKALMEGNIEAALDCITDSSKKKYKEIFELLGKAGLKKIAKDMEPIHKISENEEKAEYIIRRVEEGKKHGYFIYFTNEFGEWKIDQF